MLFKNKKSKSPDKNDEMLKVLDKDGNWLGWMEQRGIVHKKQLFYNNVAIWIFFRETGELLLEKRSFNKMHNPGKWALIGGHVVGHESLIDTIWKEIQEEIGVKIDKKNIKKLCVLEPITENKYSFSHHFYTLMPYKIKKFKLQKEEVEEVKYMSYGDYKDKLKEGNTKYSGSWKRYKKAFDLLDKILYDAGAATRKIT